MAGGYPRRTRPASASTWNDPRSTLASVRARDPTFHRPSRPAPGADRPRRARGQPAVVVAPTHPGRLRRGGCRPVGRQRPRPGRAARRGRAGAPRRAGRRHGLPRPARGRPRGPRALPRRRPLVPAEGGPRRRPGRDRLLLARVRHHRGAAAVLRRPRHPRRRPPQGGQRPRRPDHRRGAALPARLLQAGALGRGLAAGDLPGARPRRAADLAAARRRPASARSSRSTCPTARRCWRGCGWRASAGCRCSCSTPTSRATPITTAT